MLLPGVGSSLAWTSSWLPSSRIHAVPGTGPVARDLRRDLVDGVGADVAGDADGVDAVDGLAAVGLGVGEVGQHVGQPGVGVQDRRHVVDVGGRAEVLEAALGERAEQRCRRRPTKSTPSSRWPRKTMLAVPWAATAGVLVRSPSSDLDRQFLDLALHGQLQVHARLGLGGLAGLLQQGGGVRQRLARVLLTSRSTRRSGRWRRQRAAKIAKRRVCMTAS